MVLTYSPLSIYAVDLILFFIADYLFIVTGLRHSKEDRDRTYNKFGKPFIDELVGNAPTDKLEIAATAATLAATAVTAVVAHYLDGQNTRLTLTAAADRQAADHKQEALCLRRGPTRAMRVIVWQVK